MRFSFSVTTSVLQQFVARGTTYCRTSVVYVEPGVHYRHNFNLTSSSDRPDHLLNRISSDELRLRHIRPSYTGAFFVHLHFNRLRSYLSPLLSKQACSQRHGQDLLLSPSTFYPSSTTLSTPSRFSTSDARVIASWQHLLSSVVRCQYSREPRILLGTLDTETSNRV